MKKEKEMLMNDKKNLQERVDELEKENTMLRQKVKTIENNIPKIRDSIKERLNSYIDSY
jgi:predicted  nucleic acid-binding Zn-ribbon protein